MRKVKTATAVADEGINMINEMYLYFGLIALMVSLLLMKCNNAIQGKDNKSRKYFNIFIISWMIFYFVDSFWGFVGSEICFFSSSILFYISSYAFHLCATLAAFVWMVFIYFLLDIKEKSFVKIILFIPLAAALVLLALQPSTHCIFEINDMSYSTGQFRYVLFLIQNFYFDYTFLRVMPYILVNRRRYTNQYIFLVFSFLFIPIAVGVLQFLNPNMAFYSMGFLLTTLLVFNGLIVVTKEKEISRKSEKYKNESSYNYKLLESLAQNFVSIHAFDLVEDKQKMIKSTPEVEYFVKPEDTAHDQIAKVMTGVSDKEYTKGIVEFVDTYTLPERMKGKDSISYVFLGVNQGWCMSSFIKVEEDRHGNVTKCLHAVQNIDESKRKEAEYENALKRAYQSENAIYSELLKMQTSGVLATNDKEEIIIANDTALEIFDWDNVDYKKLKFKDFIKDTEVKDYDEAQNGYRNIYENGGSFTYYLSREDAQTGAVKYIMATARRIDLMDSTRIMLTCFTDITQGKEIEEKLRVLSELDALTQISNRGSGEAKTCSLIQSGASGLFCLLDINHFKSINDTYGHQIGDKALISVANAISKSFRSNDVIMRLGGDEFAIFAPNITSGELAKNCIGRLFGEIDSIIVEGMPEKSIKISLGACFVISDDKNESQTTFDDLYQKADAAMYSCKRLEGNNFRIL